MEQAEAQAELRRRALDYHAQSPAGKLSVIPSKPCKSQDDLSLAYTPGVAAPVREIAADPEKAYDYTCKGNLVAVVSNGTAVLGLGNVGTLAGKPVMEGKALLFKHFADINAFDIEVQARDAEHLIDVVAAIAPGFGGINLEDIAAPMCFQVEEALQKMLDIPVFHDDQHGTAVIVAAALQNALELQGKVFKGVKVAIVGAGAAGLAIAKMLRALGVEAVYLSDVHGVLHAGRSDLTHWHQPFATAPAHWTLMDMLADADAVIGVSVRGAIPEAALSGLAAKPVIFALANPDPEIDPVAVKRFRPDAIMATGRSDMPNQVNNVLGFPFLFRGALDCRARQINQEMLLAAVDALARLAREPVPEEVQQAYGFSGAGGLSFGPEYFIPKPLDPRLRQWVAGAVSAAARKSGVSRL
ncbi:malate dehydrogenase [Acidithiobacillus thiooxidans]|jgi:malate dehydrogenase (oxaloacetate-decarboxylating)(NADP+)|uniref:Malate dehydrogenase n=1 Tax=Acidithiobacillus thiooxidans TaxID=930 RepID=A0A1C2I2R8_ACITH|nr:MULTISPECIES: malic enzyme-like NAD(P)-binding protein [Acidithiobacillus]MBU2811232.1 malate dehydrogenase [Acidithiobacillus thiooxidans]OCX70259.1 malate dehydrogenase [Acidithiobacillus thiooxidans]OCX72524.1 malate dehydrogenase [Acidithiobacillus thiooxidans]OCX84305.1 malate dehydrogenase [Acidithiobacillus thiooxidans]OCX88921.1 malate dehydrogenase [Acidithiobacillus thiooxidans]